jgi:hypothetical protein
MPRQRNWDVVDVCKSRQRVDQCVTFEKRRLPQNREAGTRPASDDIVPVLVRVASSFAQR